MKNKKTVSVIGGDSRLIYAAEYLADQGCDVSAFCSEHGNIPSSVKINNKFDEAFNNEIIILPLPVSKNGKFLNTPLSSSEIPLKSITDKVGENNSVFLGMGQNTFMKQLSARAKTVCDYFTVESLTYKNALLTAEGLLGIILDKLPVSLFSMKIAVTGFGRISSYLSTMLRILGADVTVFARNEIQRVKAETLSIKALPLSSLENNSQIFDCIINTVPCEIINENVIKNTRAECVFIESASAPYGINFDACAKHNRTLIKAFSLPGKTAPKTAGIIIGETVQKLLEEV